MTKVVVTTFVPDLGNGQGPWIQDHEIDDVREVTYVDDRVKVFVGTESQASYMFSREYVMKVVPA